MSTIPLFRPARLTPTLLLAALLSACGGGGSDSGGSSTSNDLSDTTATSYAAQAATVGASSVGTLDSVLDATVALIGSGSSSQAASTRVRAQAAVTRSCDLNGTGSGSVTITLSGGTALSLLNNQLDAGESVTLDFSSCQIGSNSPAFSGTATLAVTSADSSSGSLAGTWTVTNLSAALSGYTVTLNGSTGVSRRVDSDVTTTSYRNGSWNAQVGASGGTPRSFAVSNGSLDVAVTRVNGVVTATSSGGSHTLTSGSTSFTVSTSGSASYDSSGLPTLGSWTLTLPRHRLVLDLTSDQNGGTATLQLDAGNDGSIDRSWTRSRTELLLAALL